MLYELEPHEAGTPEHASLLKSTWDILDEHILDEHIREEEQDLSHTLKVDESVSRAKIFARNKLFVPTRYYFTYSLAPIIKLMHLRYSSFLCAE